MRSCYKICNFKKYHSFQNLPVSNEKQLCKRGKRDKSKINYSLLYMQLQSQIYISIAGVVDTVLKKGAYWSEIS